MTAPSKPLPEKDGPEAPFWSGLSEHEVRVLRCADCGAHYFPRPALCPSCHGASLRWTPVAPTGVIETFCVFHKSYFPGFDDELPYVVIQVKLDCGVRLFSNPVGVANDQLRINMPVEAVFERTGDTTFLKFTPTGKAKA